MKVKDLLRLIEKESLSPEDEVVVCEAPLRHRPVLMVVWLNLECADMLDGPPVGYLCLSLGDPIPNDPAARKRA